MEYEAFRNRLRQKRADASSFAANLEKWKGEFSIESLSLVNTVKGLLDGLVEESLLEINPLEHLVFLTVGEEKEVFSVAALNIEYEGRNYYLLPELVGRGVGGRPELRFYGSKTMDKSGSHGHGLVYQYDQWSWIAGNSLGQPLNQDSLARALMS